MSGHITIDNQAPQLTTQAVGLAVVKFNPNGSPRYLLVPNLVPDTIERPIGPQMGAAHLHYLIDHSGLFPEWPTQFDKIWPQTAIPSRYIVVADERIAIIAYLPSGNTRMLFDGFAQIPQVDIDEGAERVSITATSCECRCWDTTITGRVQRDATDPNAGAVLSTDLPCRFNPSDGKGGITPVSYTHLRAHET